MAHNATEVANYLLSLARKEGKELTNMQLQKLVYFAHGAMLGVTDKPLIKEEVSACVSFP
jgi:uncharacterized phage-associated protein